MSGPIGALGGLFSFDIILCFAMKMTIYTRQVLGYSISVHTLFPF
jgi:hypothetical protein